MSTKPGRDPKISVLLVNTPTLPPIGADTWIHAEIVRSLDRSRFDVHVACTPGPADAPTPMFQAIRDVRDTTIVPIDFGREHEGQSGHGRLRRALEDVKMIGGVLKLAVYVRRKRIPIIHTVVRPRDALACVLLAKLTRQQCLIHMQLAYGTWMSRPLRWSLRRADGLVAITNFVSRTLVESGHRPERIHLAHNAIVFDQWKPAEDRPALRAELGLHTTAPTIITVCRLFREKGTAELVRAIGHVRVDVPDVQLLVVGRDVTGGGFMRELEAIVEEEALGDHVRFVGQRSDVPRWMAAADIFAMPSFEEPFGIVFAEAMAMELPVVALNNGGTPEVVEHGKTGLLSEHGDIETLSANLVTLLRDPELRARMGSAGRQRVADHFTVEHLASEMATIYEALAR